MSAQSAESVRYSDGLMGALVMLGNEFGPLGVALAAASLTDVDVLVAQLVTRTCQNLCAAPNDGPGGGE